MNTYSNISMELKNYFSSHSIFKLMLPYDFILIIACVGLLFLNKFIGIGGFLTAIAYYGFLFSLLLCFANLNERMLYIGAGIYAAMNLFDIFKYGVFTRYRFLDFYSIVSFLIFGALAYTIYKKTLVKEQV